jgi:hypothetical protein
LTVTQSSQRLSILVIIDGSYAHTTNGSLELDERVSVIVPIARMSFAVLAEIGVVANGTLVADALDVRQVLPVLAQRTVAVDAIVTVATVERLCQGFVDGHETMARVDVLGALDTI